MTYKVGNPQYLMGLFNELKHKHEERHPKFAESIGLFYKAYGTAPVVHGEKEVLIEDQLLDNLKLTDEERMEAKITKKP